MGILTLLALFACLLASLRLISTRLACLRLGSTTGALVTSVAVSAGLSCLIGILSTNSGELPGTAFLALSLAFFVLVLTYLAGNTTSVTARAHVTLLTGLHLSLALRDVKPRLDVATSVIFLHSSTVRAFHAVRGGLTGVEVFGASNTCSGIASPRVRVGRTSFATHLLIPVLLILDSRTVVAGGALLNSTSLLITEVVT